MMLLAYAIDHSASRRREYCLALPILNTMNELLELLL